MSNYALRVHNLGKEYRIGKNQESYSTFRDAIVQAVQSPFKRVRQILRGDAYAASNLTESIWALKDVSFDVKHGEVVGIIGHNGAGKSTLLKILSQITEPTVGEVQLYGRVGSLLEVGTGFHEELTGRENIYLNGAILGMGRLEINRKFDEIVDFSGVEKFIDTPVKHYSSGMKLRLGFAVAAHLEPEILVVDEVLAVGDAAFQKKCLGKMEDVAASGRTVLFVSHNMAAVENLCTRGVVLEQGAVIYDKNTHKAIEKYISSQNEIHNPNLASRTDRGGDGRLKFTKIYIQDTQSKTLDYVMSGQEFDICIEYELTHNTENQPCIIGINCVNQFDIPIFHQSNRIDNQLLINLPSKGTITCRIYDLPLPAGLYTLNIMAKVNETYSDSIRNALQLNVIEGDFFNTGYIPAQNIGMCLVRGKWGYLRHED